MGGLQENGQNPKSSRSKNHSEISKNNVWIFRNTRLPISHICTRTVILIPVIPLRTHSSPVIFSSIGYRCFPLSGVTMVIQTPQASNLSLSSLVTNVWYGPTMAVRLFRLNKVDECIFSSRSRYPLSKSGIPSLQPHTNPNELEVLQLSPTSWPYLGIRVVVWLGDWTRPLGTIPSPTTNLALSHRGISRWSSPYTQPPFFQAEPRQYDLRISEAQCGPINRIINHGTAKFRNRAASNMCQSQKKELPCHMHHDDSWSRTIPQDEEGWELNVWET